MPRTDCRDDPSQPALVLASASPRRRELLAALEISFSVAAADIDEMPLPGEAPEALVRRLAESKALTLAVRIATSSGGSVEGDGAGAALVLAADTEVVWAGSVLGKPADEAAARAMLLMLRGRPHRVLTGLALARSNAVVWSAVAETTVWMRSYTDEAVAEYVASGRALDKAGAYGIQDTDFHPVERIGGCYTNVVGLPLCVVRRALMRLAPEYLGGPARNGDHICQQLRNRAGAIGTDTGCPSPV